jgi:hypothetical protein
VKAVEGFDQQVQVGQLHAGKALVLKAEVEQTVTLDACGVAVGQDLPQKAGLARAPHANDGRGFAFDRRQPDIAARQHGQWRGLGVDDFLAYDSSKLTFHSGSFYLLLSL